MYKYALFNRLSSCNSLDIFHHLVKSNQNSYRQYSLLMKIDVIKTVYLTDVKN